ncbi:hypothetical protein RvY_12485 [Ramazzottius varieornatus]|uniref:Uncharacterized protein n=1 Tax=Ramazzottius varieornatus TaxID=947166 RepID=A0A1D1VLM2_RAMVA|nr:hypothetical protein RvY_12485 [Ramazzottius varieornatus]
MISRKPDIDTGNVIRQSGYAATVDGSGMITPQGCVLNGSILQTGSLDGGWRSTINCGFGILCRELGSVAPGLHGCHLDLGCHRIQPSEKVCFSKSTEQPTIHPGIQWHAHACNLMRQQSSAYVVPPQVPRDSDGRLSSTQTPVGQWTKTSQNHTLIITTVHETNARTSY